MESGIIPRFQLIGKKVFITDVKSEATEFDINLVTELTSFKFITYNTGTDYIIRA